MKAEIMSHSYNAKDIGSIKEFLLLRKMKRDDKLLDTQSVDQLTKKALCLYKSE